MILHCKATGPVATLANEMNFMLSHAPGAGSIAQPGDQHSSWSLPQYNSPTHKGKVTINILRKSRE